MNLAEQLVSRGGAGTLVDQRAGESFPPTALRSAVETVAALPELRRRRGRPVIVEVDLTARSLINLLGVVRSGAVAVPVATKVVPRRLERIVELTHADLAVTITASAASGVRRPLEQLPTMHAVDPASSGAADPASRAVGGGGDPAVVLFTSGTSGAPKGVTLTHANVIANLDAIRKVLPVAGDDRVALALPFHYSFGLSTALLSLACGGTGVIMPGLQFAGEFIDQLDRARPTVFAGVPGHYAMLLADHRFCGDRLPTLTTALQAGGPMPPSVTRRFHTAFPDCSLFLMYGQTEATARLTVLDAAKAAGKPWSVGAPLPGVTITVRDDDGEAVPPGREGELFAVGPNVMAGYWEDAEDTAGALTEHGLRTGDLGRVDADGDIEITGRRSEFAKVRGERISLREVEEVVLATPGVHDCTVQVGRTREDIDDQLRALVSLAEPDERAVLTRIRRAVVSALGPALVPELVVVVEMPLTENGKRIRHYAVADPPAPPTRG